MHLVAAGCKDLDGWDTKQAAEAMHGASFTGPGGDVAFVPETQYAAQDVHLAEIQQDASFKVLSTEKSVKPQPGCAV